MANLTIKIPNFINKAQTKVGLLTQDLLDDFDPAGYQSASSEKLLLMVYETKNFIELLTSDDFGGMTSKQINDTIDFFWSWLELNKVNFVNYTNYTMPIQANITLPAGSYALAADLTAEASARVLGDAGLDSRIDDIEALLFSPASVFPAGFFDNYNTTYAVVFDDDIRLHTHANKTDLDGITTQMVTNLSALQAHYASIGGPSGVHVSSGDRSAWNAKISASDLSTALTGYSQVGHTHPMSEVDGLESTLASMAQDIIEMAGIDGREVEFQRNVDNLEWRFVGDLVWIDLGNIKGDQGVEGDPFTIDVRALSNDRLNSLYNSEDENFSYLETDTGFLYFRVPSGGLATVPAGWSAGLKFVGDDGWSPHFGMYEVSAGRTVLELVDWLDGEGDKPFLDPGNSPPNPIRWFVGPNGYTLDPLQAINVKGPTGAGYGPIVGATGNLAGRAAHDAKPAGFIYMRTDVSPQTIFIKNSDTTADWSAELPWQGPPGSSTFPNQSANVVFAGPSTGSAAAPAFRSLVAADLPGTVFYTGGTDLSVSDGGTGASSFTAGRILVGNGTSAITTDTAFTYDTTNDSMTINGSRFHTGGPSAGFSTFIGRQAGNFTGTASNNTALGDNVLNVFTSGQQNTIVGYHAGQLITTSSNNVAIGANALRSMVSSGTASVAVGSGALSVATGGGNIALGPFAAINLTTGTGNIIIGASIEAQSNTANNQLTIQNIIFGTGNSASGTTVSSGNIGIAVVSPGARLHLPAGTATLNTAPLKFTTGVALSFPEDGAVEYHGSHLWFTIGGTRFQLDQQSVAGISGTTLVAGRVPFATGAAAVTDDDDFTWDSTTRQLFLGNGSTNHTASSFSYQGIIVTEAVVSPWVLQTQQEISIQSGLSGTGDITLIPASGAGKIVSSGKHLFDVGISNDGFGFKHKRVSTGSVTAGSTALITITWGTAFLNTNYTVVAMVEDSTTAVASLVTVHIESKTTSAVTVRVVNNSAGSLTGTVHVIAVHD
jgi:hypothetical protein